MSGRRRRRGACATDVAWDEEEAFWQFVYTLSYECKHGNLDRRAER